MVRAAALLVCLLGAAASAGAFQPGDVGEVMGGVVVMEGAEAVPIERILVPKQADAYEKLAASRIAGYLEKICGVKPAVAEYSDSLRGRGSILIGRAAVQAGVFDPRELNPLAPDGYAIRSGKGCVGIAGYRGVGTLYGAVAFLGRLGVKYYAPGCETVPQARPLRIPAMDVSDRPAFDFRFGLWMDCTPEQGFTPEDDSPPAGRVDSKCGAGWDHTASYQCPKYLYYDSHPEYFAKDDKGKNIEFGRLMDVQLCLSNPRVREIAGGRVLEWMDKQPQGKYYCVTQGDGSSWCRCPACRKLDPDPWAMDEEYPRRLSDRLLDYVNSIARKTAKKHPDKVILTLAYTPATQPPPRRTRPEPNVKVMFCPYPTPGGALCNSHDLLCPRNAGALADLKGWLAWCPDNVYIYDYPCDYQNEYEPLGSFYAMARKIKFYHFCGIKGIYFCGGPSLFRGLFNYCMGRLLWHPELDVEELINEFMPAYYGAAAPMMREYFNLLYNRVDDHAAPFHTYCEASNPGLVTPQFAAKAYAIFDRGKEAVKADPLLLERVKWEEFCGVLWSDLNENTKGKLLENGGLNTELLAKFRKLAEISAAREVYSFVRGDRENLWITRTFGIPIGDEAWFQDSLVKKLLSPDAGSVDAGSIERALVQKPGDAGIELMLTGFTGAAGPQAYDYQCPRRAAVWINPKGRENSAMGTAFFLDAVPGRAKLVVDALDDDKPGSTRIRVVVNDRPVFTGANGAKEDSWTPLAYDIPAGTLKKGRNTLGIENMEASSKPNEKWFMISGAKLVFE